MALKNKDETNNEAGIILKQFESVRSYKRAMGFESNWSTYIDFVEGRQWVHTDKNKNMPKPVHNIIKFAKKAKTAAVLSDNINTTFSPVEEIEADDIANEAAEMINNATKDTMESIEQDRLDAEVVSDAFDLGTGLVHYYWDNNIVGGYKTMYKGNIQGETLDAMNVFPGNPQEKDKDKQPFWIVTYRDMVANVKKIAKDNGISKILIENISADKDTAQETYEASRHEVSGEDKTTVYVKYWRDLEDNKIYFEKCTKGVLFQPKTNLWDYNETDLEPYPIAYFNWEDRKKSIFGIGEVEGMIYNQKAINFVDAMRILNVQDTGWNKYIEKFNALGGQKIQNVPGEIIVDKSSVPGDNIKPMQPATMSPQVAQVFDDLITNTRIFNGVSESVTGENLGANVSAAAIIAVQNQNDVPLDSIRKKFKRYRHDVAKIYEFFFKCKFNLPRMIKVTDDEGNTGSVEFTGSKYKDIPLSLKINIGAGSKSSESLSTATADKFLDKGYVTPMQYAEIVSDNVMPWKEKFKKMKELEQKDQLMQAKQALQKQQATIQKLQQQLGVQPMMQGGGMNGGMQQMQINPQMQRG